MISYPNETTLGLDGFKRQLHTTAFKCGILHSHLGSVFMHSTSILVVEESVNSQLQYSSGCEQLQDNGRNSDQTSTIFSCNGHSFKIKAQLQIERRKTNTSIHIHSNSKLQYNNQVPLPYAVAILYIWKYL